MTLARRAVAEALGTALLLVAVVGSGIMGERLSAGNMALALLANSIATGGALVAILYTLAPISGAHLNPVVSIADAFRGGIGWRSVPVYGVAQTMGAFIGVAVADGMFGLPAYSVSHHARTSVPILVGEVVATFGLLVIVFGCSRANAPTPIAVAAYITGAYWFTSSTSFANPAVTIARSVTDTFVGIRPIDAPAFVVAQTVGATAAIALLHWLIPEPIVQIHVQNDRTEQHDVTDIRDECVANA